MVFYERPNSGQLNQDPTTPANTIPQSIPVMIRSLPPPIRLQRVFAETTTCSGIAGRRIDNGRERRLLPEEVKGWELRTGKFGLTEGEALLFKGVGMMVFVDNGGSDILAVRGT